MTNSPPEPPKASALAAGGKFSVRVLSAMALGAFADHRLGCKPWGILGGMGVGMLIATWIALRPLWAHVNGADRAPQPPKTNDEL